MGKIDVINNDAECRPCLQKFHRRRIPVDVANHPGFFIAPHADALPLPAAHRDICGEQRVHATMTLRTRKRTFAFNSHFTLSATSALAPVPALLVAWQT